jgi:hypothetical protein
MAGLHPDPECSVARAELARVAKPQIRTGLRRKGASTPLTGGQKRLLRPARLLLLLRRSCRGAGAGAEARPNTALLASSICCGRSCWLNHNSQSTPHSYILLISMSLIDKRMSMLLITPIVLCWHNWWWQVHRQFESWSLEKSNQTSF